MSRARSTFEYLFDLERRIENTEKVPNAVRIRLNKFIFWSFSNDEQKMNVHCCKSFEKLRLSQRAILIPIQKWIFSHSWLRCRRFFSLFHISCYSFDRIVTCLLKLDKTYLLLFTCISVSLFYPVFSLPIMYFGLTISLVCSIGKGNSKTCSSSFPFFL